MRHLCLSAVLAVPLTICLSPVAQAGSITGSSILVTSVFDGGTPETFDFSDITAERIDGGVFDWMIGADLGTNFTIIPGTPNGDETRNELDINFSGDTNFHTFSSTDTLDLTFQLSPGLVFNQSFFALTEAIDANVPEASASGGTFNVELTGLDQINVNGGKIQYIFDAESVPEPSTVGLMLIGCAILAFKLRRSRSAEQA